MSKQQAVLLSSVYVDQMQPNYEMSVEFLADTTFITITWSGSDEVSSESVCLDREQALNLAENIIDRYKEATK